MHFYQDYKNISYNILNFVSIKLTLVYQQYHLIWTLKPQIRNRPHKMTQRLKDHFLLRTISESLLDASSLQS